MAHSFELCHSISDEVEFVVAGAVNCLASLCDLGIFKKQRLIEIVEKCAPLLLHPNTWIRYGAASIMLSVARKLSLADTRCFLIPKLRKFLVRDIAEVTKATLLQSLSPPVSRKSFEKALSCSYDATAATSSASATTTTAAAAAADDGLDDMKDGSQVDEIDIPFSMAIADLDVPPEDERKLLAMKEFIKLTALKRFAHLH
jgi:phosphoinositide-3-kinase regulatory subunit 4